MTTPRSGPEQSEPEGLRSIAGRVAIVTGAASGMGLATARLFAAEGARVGLIDRDPAVLDLAMLLDGRGPPLDGSTVRGAVGDLADRSAVAEAIAELRSTLGPIDIVVNNAGVAAPAPLGSDGFVDAWDQALAINTTAQALVVRECLSDLTRHGDGRVVNVASTEGLAATPHMAAYTASKHAVVGLSRALAVELGSQGVTVNCVCPGPINTSMTAVIPDTAKQKYARRRVPMQRYGEPSEVAHMILSLVLPAASFVNGAVLTVDGGLSAKAD